MIKKGNPSQESKTKKRNQATKLKLTSKVLEVTKLQQEVIETNIRVISLFYFGVSESKYDKISTSEIAKKIWNKLEVTYKGTTKVKESRIGALINE